MPQVPQRHRLDWEDRQTEEEVLPKLRVLHGLLQIEIGGYANPENAQIDLDATVRNDARHQMGGQFR